MSVAAYLFASDRASASEPGADGVWGRSPHRTMANIES